MIINIKSPNTEGRKSILRYYLDQVKHSDEIDVTRLALLTTGLYGSDLKSIVNFAAIKAVQDNDVEIDDRYANLKKFISTLKPFFNKLS